MIQFYKKRDFGTLVSDTFTFFKENGKNYFKNYILLNGLLLIFMVALFVFGYREIFSQLFKGNTAGESYYFEAYFQENQVMLILVSIVLFIIFMAAMILNYSYPVLYMKRLSETGNTNIKADDILSDIKGNFGRFILFFLGMMFIVMPLATIIFGVTYILIFIIIGFFLMILVMPAMMNVINFLLYDYLHTKKGFFESLSYAMRAQFSYQNGSIPSPFWKYWGSTAVIYLIIQVVSTVFTIIPVIILFAGIYTVESSGAKNQNPFDGTMGILFFVFYGVAILASLIITNIVYINAGLMYYDSRTDLHQKEDITEIESIGNAL